MLGDDHDPRIPIDVVNKKKKKRKKKYFPCVRRKVFYTVRLIVFSVLQIGQVFKLSTLSHSSHNGICPQMQNKTLGGIDGHIIHSSDLNVLSVVSSSSSSSSDGFSKARYPSPKTKVLSLKNIYLNYISNIYSIILPFV